MVFQPTIISEVYIIWEMINLKDKRFDKTEAALKSAITELLRTKNINEITVVELCRLAGVNKSTFYLHYRDIYEYYDYLIQDIATRHRSIYEKYNYEEFVNLFPDIFVNVLNIIKQDELMKIMISRDNSNVLISKVTESITEAIIAKKSTWYENILQTEMNCRFIVFGTMGVIQGYSDMIFSNPDIAKPLAERIKAGFIEAGKNPDLSD